MRQTADILSGKAAMQIRYLEAIKSIASQNNVKVVFLAEDNWEGQLTDIFIALLKNTV